MYNSGWNIVIAFPPPFQLDNIYESNLEVHSKLILAVPQLHVYSETGGGI